MVEGGVDSRTRGPYSGIGQLRHAFKESGITPPIVIKVKRMATSLMIE